MERKDFRIPGERQWNPEKRVVELFGAPSEVELIKDALTILITESRKNEVLGVRFEPLKDRAADAQRLLEEISQPNYASTRQERQTVRTRVARPTSRLLTTEQATN